MAVQPFSAIYVLRRHEPSLSLEALGQHVCLAGIPSMRRYVDTTAVLAAIHLFVSAALFAVFIALAAESSGGNGRKYSQAADVFVTLYKVWNAGFAYLWVPSTPVGKMFPYACLPFYFDRVNALMFVAWAAFCGALAAWPLHVLRGRESSASPKA